MSGKDKSMSAAGGKAQALLPPPDLPPPAAAAARDDQQAADQLDDEGAPAFQQNLAMLLMGEEDDAEGSGDMDAVAAAIATLIKGKAAKAQQKRQQIIAELQSTAAAQIKDFEAAVAKEHKELAAMVTKTTSGPAKRLAEQFAKIEHLNAKWREDLRAAWDDYNAIYTRIEDTKDQTIAHIEKRRAGQKRKLAALQDALAERVTEAQAKLAKLTSSSAKSQNISSVLSSLMRGGLAE